MKPSKEHLEQQLERMEHEQREADDLLRKLNLEAKRERNEIREMQRKMRRRY